ncbi:chloride channel protein 2-like isoform X3 [Branchiostoma lanceolatum]|uniref:chloride channel protein 2-like isoform X3 n=1 Tax=Branchiostoma lanceolatum TaxID=7740 RepID=UPI00345494D8
MAEAPAPKSQLDYEQTLMYGKYTKELGDYARVEAERLRAQRERRREKERRAAFMKYKEESRWQRCKSYMIWCRNVVFAKIGEDWIFLLLLGVSMALLSFAVDFTIAKCQKAHYWLYMELSQYPLLQYLAWVMFPVIFISFSAGFTHIVSANAIGSGIPEMKTILRGVVLKEYLSFRTLIAKIIGLITALGSGLPLGKEGPFVHIASMVAQLLSKLVTSFRGIYENESRNSEMLAAACAVGVSCNFAAPIGGVLFSIEVTSTYFAVRNYWRGFFSAVCGAFIFRLLAVWNREEETITALFKTQFRVDYPFDVQELLAFAVIGIVCGFGGALFVYFHRQVVYFNRKHRRLTYFLQKNRFIYPALIAFVCSSLTFPLGLGQYMAGELTQKEAINELFDNHTWTKGQADVDEELIISHWKHPQSNIFVTLVIFIVMNFWMSAMAVTLPVPAGVFIPVFVLGAAFGRLVGESMAAWFPLGVRSDGIPHRIIPGGYAVAGAAALSGAVTHTVSTSVIVFELTGQIAHILPVLIAVLVANVISQWLQPSIYDSIIQIKRLPYLPDIGSGGSGRVQGWAHNVYVEDIMVREVKFISYISTYKELKNLLDSCRLSSFPLVDAPESMILLGSVKRWELEDIMEDHLSNARRRLVMSHTNHPSVRFNAAGDGDIEMKDIRVVHDEEEDKEEEAAPTNQETVTVVDFTRHGISASPADPPKSILKKSPLSSPATSPNGSPKAKRAKSQFAKKTRASIDIRPKEMERVWKDRKITGSGKGKKDYPNPAHESPYRSMFRPREETPHRQQRRASLRRPSDDWDIEELADIGDLTPEQLTEWEEEQLQDRINFDAVTIDPAPFQLVERTSLHKVHSLFSLLGLHHAYVTTIGRLIGVVSLKEVRKAIEGSQEDIVEVPKSPPKRKTSNDIPMSDLDHTESSSEEEDNRLMSDSSDEGTRRQEFRFTVTDVDADGVEDSKV